MKAMRSFAALMVVLMAGGAAADDFPSQPIRFVVPFSAGGPTDTAGRLIAGPLQKQLGQPIVIENRPGASGVPATELVVSGANDGYTLVVGGIAPIVLVPAVRKLRYDVDKDLVPLGLIWRSPQVLAVRASLDVKTVADLVAYAKANPRQAHRRLGRHRHHHPPRQRAVPARSRHQLHPRALSQHVELDHRPDGRPDRRDLRRCRDPQPAGEGRQHQAAGDHRDQALAAAARSADHGRGRIARGPDRGLVRPAGAGADARAGAGAPEGRGESRAIGSGLPRRAC